MSDEDPGLTGVSLNPDALISSSVNFLFPESSRLSPQLVQASLLIRFCQVLSLETLSQLAQASACAKYISSVRWSDGSNIITQARRFEK
jgi:hypothetical protein